MPGWTRDALLTALGLILAMTPLALWVAWSETIYYAILLICALAMALVVMLTRRGG